MLDVCRLLQSTEYLRQIQETAAFITKSLKLDGPVDVAVVLGSGLSTFTSQLENTTVCYNVPHSQQRPL
jgi:purine nucleoside phosphorylase